MEDRLAQETTFRSQTLRWSWILVVACGLLLGYYVFRTYEKPRHRQYQLDFGKAQWIEPADSPAPIAYFRKEIYLDTLPEQAWLEVAASDNFELIVNGQTVGTLTSVKTFEAGIYDIKKPLKVGTNVIGVSMEWPNGIHVECGWRQDCFGELAAVCGAYLPEYRRQSIYGGLLR